METHYSISIIISILPLPKLFLKPQLTIKLFSPLRTLFGPFPPPEKRKRQLGARSHRHRTSATDFTNLHTGGNINTNHYLLFTIFASCYSLFTVLFHVICFLLFQLQERIQISFRFSLSLFNSYIIELLLRNPYSLVGAHSHKLG